MASKEICGERFLSSAGTSRIVIASEAKQSSPASVPAPKLDFRVASLLATTAEIRKPG
jgi:hypothetical protein